MKKSSKPSLSRKGIAQNKKGIIIIVLILSLIMLGLFTFKKKEIYYKEEQKYFAGELYSINHAANMIDYIDSDDNLIISPLNVNTSLAILYNGTDNNSKKEIKKYFNKNVDKVNEELKEKISLLTFEQPKESKFTKLYESLIDDLQKKAYDSLTISKIDLLSNADKEKIVLLLKKIELTMSRINNENKMSEKSIKNYKLSKNEITTNSYAIKQSLDKTLNQNESYNIINNINSYNRIYTKALTKKEIEEKYINSIKSLEGDILIIDDSDSNKEVKKINDDIKKITEDNIMRIVELEDLNNEDTIMINNLYFNYEWENSFKKNYVTNEEFYNLNESIGITEMMYNIEDIYLENEYAKGFVKYFEDKKYSFVGILPNKTGDFNLSNLNLNSLLNSQKNEKVVIGLPKFSYQYETDLKKLYSNYNITEIFTDKSNFSKISSKNFKINKAIQKININIGEKGTVESNIASYETENSSLEETEKQIILNRPFAFAIIESETNEVLLIGKVVNLNEGS